MDGKSRVVVSKVRRVGVRTVARCLGKFAVWLSAMVVAMCLLLAGALYVIYKNPAKMVNLVMAEVLGGQVVEIDRIMLPEPGLLRIEGLRLSGGQEEAAWLDLGEVEIVYDWQELMDHRHVKSLRLKRPKIRIDEAVLQALALSGLEGAKGEKPQNKGLDLGFLALISDEIKVEQGAAEIEWPGVPPMNFSFDVDFKGLGSQRVGLGVEGWISAEPLLLSLRDFEMKPESGGLSVAGIELEVLVSRHARVFEIKRLQITAPQLEITPQLLKTFATAQDAGKTGGKVIGEVEGEGLQVGLKLTIDQLEVDSGHFALRGFDGRGGARLLPDVDFGWSLSLLDLKVGEEGVVSSAAGQKVGLSDVRVGGVSRGEALLEVRRVSLEFRGDDLLNKSLVDKLWIESPRVVLSDAALSRSLPVAKTRGVVGKSAPITSGEGEMRAAKIWEVSDLKVTKGSLLVDLKESVQGVPWLSSDFELKTLPLEFAEGKRQIQESRYRLLLSSLRIQPTLKAGGATMLAEGGEQKAGLRKSAGVRDVAFVRDLIVELTSTGLQKNKRIESVVVAGGSVKLNDDFNAVLNGGKTDKFEAEEEETKSKSSSGWSIGKLGVNHLLVKLESMVPQLQGVQFSVETTMEDVPLTPQGLLSKHRVQQVEIAGIELRDPYDGMRSAALLPTIFLKFSLAGLMRQEVEAIDILGPVLYIGEPLFNWVDYQRKYRKQNEGTTLQPDEREVDELEGEAEKKESGSWTLKKINAHYGKMVIAPIGTPIGIVPFPFAVETDFEDGRIALNLEIPQEQYVYSLSDLKLNLYGLSGNVEFNVPIQQKANNLVQTFKLDRLVWKQFDAEKIFVSVTYDANGIYGKLGGAAYEGYVNGEFNIYLKDLGEWDAWLAATKVNMAPISRAIAPENFVMDGTITGKLISGGKGLELGKTTGELWGVTPGRIEITKLDSVLEALPAEWTQLKRSLTELALNGLKTFDYQQAKGKIDLLNRDGEVSLDLRGPTGSRMFHFHLHDWRKKKKTAAGSEVVVGP